MSSVIIAGDTSGSVTLAAPAVSGTTTLTLPATTGTVITNTAGTVTQTMLAAGVVGNGPAFFVYASANQSIANNTAVKIQLNTEIFDTASAFDSTTNYRFTPTVAGYYQINSNVWYGSAPANGSCQAKIYKNGSEFTSGLCAVVSGAFSGASASSVIFLNGSTDYVELYTAQSTGTTYSTNGGSAFITMSGSLVRTS